MNTTRTIELTYSVNLPELHAKHGTVEIWLPLPLSTPHQELLQLEVDTAVEYSTHFDPVYGNWILHAQIEAGAISEVAIRYRATVRRHEWRVDTHRPLGRVVKPSPVLMRNYLRENRRIRFLPEIIAVAEKLQAECPNAIDIARGAYEHVLTTMSYDKSGEGWGQGDTEWACSAGRGNCTDFHSLYLAILRATGVPAQFEIGAAFPAGMTGGDITGFKCGHHCWVSFYTPEYGWVPADVSEAAQKDSLRGYYFGAIDADRVLLSRGRDIVLEPKPQGDPENFFTDPRLQTSNGSPVIYEKKLEFKDL